MQARLRNARLSVCVYTTGEAAGEVKADYVLYFVSVGLMWS